MKINNVENKLLKESLYLKQSPLNLVKARQKCLDAAYLASIRNEMGLTDNSTARTNLSMRDLGLF